MSIYSLKPNPTLKPNLENVRKRAKSLLKAVRAGDPQAIVTIGPYFGDGNDMTLQSAQLAIAREWGFSSWLKFKQFIDADPAAGFTRDQLASQFLELVTVQYGSVENHGTQRFAQAKALLDAHPEIRHESIYTACAIGDRAEIERWLNKDPGLLNRKGGFYHWSPLMYATYARLPGASTLAAAQLLLDYGADANAYFMWGGQYKFTALTGAFGHGEAGPIRQPEHPEFEALCRLLLEHGAHANDSQAAYNRCFTADNTCLELLIEFGLNGKQKNNWLVGENENKQSNPSEVMHFHLIHAIRNGFVERAKLLIDAGVDVNKPDDSYETRLKGKTPYEVAQLLGEQKIAEYLLEAGAQATQFSPLLEFQMACSLGRSERVSELLAEHPTLISESKPVQYELLLEAIKRSRLDALRLMINLNFELNTPNRRPLLAEAALAGQSDTVQLLLEHGADPTQRDPSYFSTAIGFALHANHADIIAMLDATEMDVFTAASRGNLVQLSRHLEGNPALVNQRFKEIRPNPTKPCENDWMTPLAYATLNNQVDAMRLLLQHGANAAPTNPEGETLLHLAQLNKCTQEVIDLLRDKLT